VDRPGVFFSRDGPGEGVPTSLHVVKNCAGQDARLESAVSTGVKEPVVAVIEDNFEREAESVVPGGAKAIGQLRQADRSGNVDTRVRCSVLCSVSRSSLATHHSSLHLHRPSPATRGSTLCWGPAPQAVTQKADR